MGGEDHGTIRVSVLEQMADAHLARVDDFTIQGMVCCDAPHHVIARYYLYSFFLCSAISWHCRQSLLLTLYKSQCDITANI